MTILGESDEPVPLVIADAPRLTRFAITTRYPGVTEPVTVEEYEQAVAIAEAVVQWAEVRLAEGR